jgi:hypothetical protein
MVSPLLSTLSESSRHGAMDRRMNSTSPTPTGCPPESRPSVCVRADIGHRAMQRYRLPSVTEVATYLFRSVFTLNFNLTRRASAPALPLCVSDVFIRGTLSLSSLSDQASAVAALALAIHGGQVTHDHPSSQAEIRAHARAAISRDKEVGLRQGQESRGRSRRRSEFGHGKCRRRGQQRHLRPGRNGKLGIVCEPTAST